MLYNIKKNLLYAIAAFSGFAVIPFTKIYGIQIFVYLVILYVGISILSGGAQSLTREANFYKKFVLWSIPALIISIFIAKYDAIYFFIYTLLPFLLYKYIDKDTVNWKKFLFIAQIPLVIVILIGWAIYQDVLPPNYLYFDVNPVILESEKAVGYWGISYLPSTRNHDYMYVYTCACICLFLINEFKSKILKYLESAMFFFCLVTLLVTLSRGAMIIAAWLFYCFMKTADKRIKKWVSSALILVVVINIGIIIVNYEEYFKNIFLSIFGLSNENHTGGGFSNEMRKNIYWNAIVQGAINPIGYGIQNYGFVSKGYGSAENAYLTVFVERGWFATIFFVKYLYFSFKRAGGDILKYTLAICLMIYFLFNYEFTSYMNVFIFTLLLVNRNNE